MKNLFLILCSVPITSCSCFRSSLQEITITTTPPHVHLNINSKKYESPITLSVPRDTNCGILAQQENYAPLAYSLHHHLSTTGLMDTFGTFCFLLPGIGLWFPGIWDLDKTTIHLIMDPIHER